VVFFADYTRALCTNGEMAAGIDFREPAGEPPGDDKALKADQYRRYGHPVTWEQRVNTAHMFNIQHLNQKHFLLIDGGVVYLLR
ncbi:MAG: hypothetical protein Q4Q03_03515, partial [Bowdeniella nasicola]|nr:hypothetical protein [Bowdeniella nasicola]